MKVRSIFIPVFLSLFAILFYSCEDSSVSNNSNATVSGTVRGSFNYPLSNVTVSTQGKSTLTAVNGKFSISNVSLPCDLYVSDTLHKYQILYKNVNSSSDLTIGLPVNLNDGLVSYNLIVHLPPATPPHIGKVFFMDDESNIMGVQDLGPFNISFSAPANVPMKGKVYVITYTRNPAMHITDFKYFASKSDVSLVSGSNTEITFGQSELLPVTEDTVNYIVTLPSGSLGGYYAYMLNFYNKRMSYYANFLALETFQMPGSISMVIPNNLPIDFTPSLFSVSLGAFGTANQMYALPKTGTNVPVNLSSVPTVISPQDYALNVDANTTFSFQKQPISNVITYTLTDSTSGQKYAICTTDNSITLSQMSQMLSLSPSKLYSYDINQVGVNITTVGDLLTSGRTPASFSGTPPTRYFTTKP
ncbi:MAG: hypothetical protein ACOYN6_09780 [Ignavibacteria bacterium]